MVKNKIVLFLLCILVLQPACNLKKSKNTVYSPGEQAADVLLIKASEEGDLALAKLALACGAKVSNGCASACVSFIALHAAVVHKHAEIVEILLKYGANPNFLGYGITPLMSASFHGDIEVVRLLLKHGAYVNTKGSDGITALFIAVVKNHYSIAKLLIEHKADINIKEKGTGLTPLDCALRKKNAEMVQLLLEYKAVQGSAL